MTTTARNNFFVHILFLPPLLLILTFKPILSHTYVMEGHYMVCSIEEEKKREEERRREEKRRVKINIAKSMSPAMPSGE